MNTFRLRSQIFDKDHEIVKDKNKILLGLTNFKIILPDNNSFYKNIYIYPPIIRNPKNKKDKEDEEKIKILLHIYSIFFKINLKIKNYQ